MSNVLGFASLRGWTFPFPVLVGGPADWGTIEVDSPADLGTFEVGVPANLGAFGVV
jgi:hypothetical protein